MKRTVALLALCVLLLTPGGATAGPVSQPDIEDEVMCVTCNVPLNIAESPQAERQKAIIRREIERGRTKREIKDLLVAEYGEDVLGVPDQEGFGITAFAVPAVLSIGLVAAILFFIPRWRRGGEGSAADGSAGGALSVADTRRLDEDIARYDV